MLITVLLFCIGLALLVKGADFFVEGGSGLAKRFGVSAVTIGFTIIAFGTSLPEFLVSINAILMQNSDIALGNVLGSNIANIALVLALCALIKPSLVGWKAFSHTIREESMLMLGATAAFILLAFRGVLDLVAGVILLVLFIIILWTLWRSVKNDRDGIESHGNLDYLYTGGGLISVILGSQLLLDNAVILAEMLGIPTFIIGISIVAVGTSLPELVTSVVAILKGNPGISAGNILGSNIFNLLLVMGCGALIRPIPIPNFTDVLIMGVFSAAVLPLFCCDERFTRSWALILILCYAGYIGVLFGIL